jgi:hypothetical protein
MIPSKLVRKRRLRDSDQQELFLPAAALPAAEGAARGAPLYMVYAYALPV